MEVYDATGALKVTSMNSGITARKNTGTVIGPEPQINLIEGTGISLTVADDTVSAEFDVTITAKPLFYRFFQFMGG